MNVLVTGWFAPGTAPPSRIQRRRVKGRRMPADTVYVGRGSRWGNPFALGTQSGLARVPALDGGPWEYEDRISADGMQHDMVVDGVRTVHHVRYMTRAECVEVYRQAVTAPSFRLHVPLGPGKWLTTVEIRRGLAGRDLACWCALEDEHGKSIPCHADVLLELANGSAL